MIHYTKISEKLPPEGEIVLTKIDDITGIRNEAELIRKGRLFFTTDLKMYVYYTPTHWAKKTL